MEKTRYRAFISYSHDKEQSASWIQRALERYRAPAKLVRRHTLASNKLGRIFRDRNKLSSSWRTQLPLCFSMTTFDRSVSFSKGQRSFRPERCRKSLQRCPQSSRDLLLSIARCNEWINTDYRGRSGGSGHHRLRGHRSSAPGHPERSQFSCFLTRQPTSLRLKTSMTKAVKITPRQVLIKAKSATLRRLG